MVLTISRRLGYLILAPLLILVGGLAVPSEAVPSQDKKPAGKEAAPAVLKAEPLKIEPGDDELAKLLRQRYNAAVAELQARNKALESGNGTVEDSFGVARKVLRSELALSDKPADRIAVREKHLELEQAAEKIATIRFHAGKITDADLAAARYLRLDAEVQLLKAKRKAK